jgi:cytochrome c peroxidase
LNLDLGNLLDYTPQLPAHYAGVQALDNAPAGIVASNAAATLGRVLFYDKSLSVNDTTSCASCHQQSTDFADSKRFSLGFEGNPTAVHSMRLANVRYWQPGNMFWNRRSSTLEVQATQPPQNSVEMGFDAAHGGITAFVSKLAAQPYYADLFTAAFGDPTVNEDRVQQALAQFMRGMVSTNSRWDAAYAQVFNAALPDKGLSLPTPGLTQQEDRGRHLFMALPAQGGLACATCHLPPTFALNATSGSNGLDAGETTVFKSPSLKNVAQSATFMHDGRFSSLEEVVEHYASGVKDGPALDSKMKGPDGLPRLRNIAPEDRAALVAFLKTLSDPVLATDPRFSDPFRR